MRNKKDKKKTNAEETKRETRNFIFSNMEILTKEEYINIFKTKADKIVSESTEGQSFIPQITEVDEIVGYYLDNYGDDALSVWSNNISKVPSLSKRDIEVTKILEYIFKIV